MSIELYDAELFTRAIEQVVIKGKNNAPGGAGGVDEDVQYRLGADGSAAQLDRRHGICCGIVVAWLTGLCHGNADTFDVVQFRDHFVNTLRFQGAYLKDHKGNVGSIDDLDGIMPLHLERAGQGKCAVDGLAALYPAPSWAAYLGVWQHAVGIGIYDAGAQGKHYCVMEPNAGLFKFRNEADLSADVRQLCEARRLRRGKSPQDEIAYTFFKKKA